MLPPWASTIDLQMLSPRPTPPCRRSAVELGLGESLEHPVPEIRWNPRAMIGDGNAERAVLPLDIHLDMTVGFRELHRIRQEIIQNLLNADRVGIELNALSAGRDVERDGGGVGADALVLHDLLKEGLKIDHRLVEAESARTHAREVEQVVHDGHEPRAVAARQIDQILQLLGERRGLAGLDDCERAMNRRQWRTQLVADLRQEFILGDVGVLPGHDLRVELARPLLHLLLQLFLQAGAAQRIANLTADAREHPAVILREGLLGTISDEVEKSDASTIDQQRYADLAPRAVNEHANQAFARLDVLGAQRTAIEQALTRAFFTLLSYLHSGGLSSAPEASAFAQEEPGSSDAGNIECAPYGKGRYFVLASTMVEATCQAAESVQRLVRPRQLQLAVRQKLIERGRLLTGRDQQVE